MNSAADTTAQKTASSNRLEELVSLEILRTAADIEHFATEGFKEFGLTMTQYNVLRILRGAGESGLCRNEVGARMIAPVPDATRLIDRLIAAGYAQKHKNIDDKRYTTTRITDKGLELLAQMDQPILDMHRTQLGLLSNSELKTLESLLKKAQRKP
jgi:DNA-binding MarR family transcriptional regulator